MNTTIRFSVAALILAAGMVFSSVLLSKFFVRIRQEQAIRVKGYAECPVHSDIGKFYCHISARGGSLAESYEALQNSKGVAMKYLLKSGFQDSEIVVATIDTFKIHRKDAQGKETNEIEYYNASQSIAVMSTNVHLVRQVATGITDLIREGVDISAGSPEFYVSRLDEAKLELLSMATEDGYRRAVKLAEKSHGRIGALISAQQGVFQITTPYSTESSSMGIYDTATIDKTAKAVVTLDYAIESNR